MYSFSTSRTLHADPDGVWAAWNDPDSFPRGDPREIRTQRRSPPSRTGTDGR